MEWNGVERLETRKEGSNYSCIWSGLVWSGLVAAECVWQATHSEHPHVFKMLSENVSIFTILALSKPATS